MPVFGPPKSHGNPNFGFDLLTSVRFGFLKTETEPTFGFKHIPSYNTRHVADISGNTVDNNTDDINTI